MLKENSKRYPEQLEKLLDEHTARLKKKIDEQRQSEITLQKAHDKLRRQFEQCLLEHKRIYEQLLHTEKLCVIGKLSSTIVHELNNPIFGIRNVLKEIKKSTSLNKDNTELVDLAIYECKRIKEFIAHLQDFNRPTSAVVTPMDIHKTINNVLLLCRKQFNTKKIRIEKDYATNMPKIMTVNDQIQQVILNLLINAEEAISKDGGTIKVTTKVLKQKVVIQIHDSGEGIKPEVEDRIFEPFFSTKSSKNGTGLGLSISYEVIKDHGGNIELKSKPGKGTSFLVTLPIRGK
jgi:C4-dicarboxylate-specific signal transduction histidine kinase